ncbi:MAG TPA: CHRD domain-containing protein [Anaerolineales bacterium]|nr:CHRD domain-containing protein [Anaerolineales bacterium]
MSTKRLFLVLGIIALTAVSGIASQSADHGLRFEARLTGAREVPPVVTNTSGRAEFKVNSARTEIQFELKISKATDILAAAGAHIHCGAKGVNGPIVAFLAGPVTGGFDGKVEIEATLTQANITNTACGATISALVQSMLHGNAYVNAHSAAHPGGEIRGQIELDD